MFKIADMACTRGSKLLILPILEIFQTSGLLMLPVRLLIILRPSVPQYSQCSQSEVLSIPNVLNINTYY